MKKISSTSRFSIPTLILMIAGLGIQTMTALLDSKYQDAAIKEAVDEAVNERLNEKGKS